MGTDIHGVWQARRGSEWVDVESTYEQGRDYQLFAALADVRNGSGFAGIRTGDTIDAINHPRGLPPDFEMVGEDHLVSSVDVLDPRRREWRMPDEPLAVWMGDHSHSWLTSGEMLAWFRSAAEINATGVITREQYAAWDGAEPSDWSAGIMGPRIVVETASAPGLPLRENTTHVRVTWRRDLHEYLAYFFNEVQRLHDLHGEVRFVFGFDS